MSGRLGIGRLFHWGMVKMSSGKCQLLIVDGKTFEDGELEYW